MRRYLLFLLLTLFTVWSFGQETFILSDRTTNEDLSPYLSYYIDSTNCLQLQDVLLLQRQNKFNQNGNQVPSLGITNKNSWFLMKLQNKSQRKDWLINLNFPNFTSVIMNLLDSSGNKIFTQERGIENIKKQNEHIHRSPLFNISLQDTNQYFLFFEIRTVSSLIAPFRIYSPDAFLDDDRTHTNFAFTLLGIIIASFIFNLILFILARERTYLYLSLALLTFFLYYFFYYGFGFEYFPSLPTKVLLKIRFELYCITGIFYTLFSLHYLGLKKKTFIRWIFIGMLMFYFLFLGVWISGIFYGNIILNQLTVLSYFVFTTILITIGFLLLRKGYRHARYYLIAFGLHLVAAVLFSGTFLGLMHHKSVVEYANLTATAVFGLLLTIGLIEKIASIRQEKERSALLEIEKQELSKEIETRRLLEKELILAKEQAEEANRAKTEFLANISHEIRTPLNSILGFSELLAEELTDEEYQQHISGIVYGGKSLLGIINDLLDLTKIESGKLVLLKEHVNIVDLCNEIIGMFSVHAKEKGIEMYLYTQSLKHQYYILDEVRLRQVLLNLIGNSTKYTHEGNINLVLSNTEETSGTDTLTIEVQDEGIGISKEQQEKIFSPFHQASEQQSRLFGGTGLGLSISRKLMELMNGEISVESEVGKGSRFTITLYNVRRSEAQEVSGPADPEQAPVLNFQNSSLLVVEDNHTNLEIVKAFLSSYNVSVSEADNGATALALLEKLKPELILMDIQMPVMDGYETIKQIRSRKDISHIPVIALTAGVISEKNSEILKLFDGLLYKPIERKKLIQEIKRFLPFSETLPENVQNELDKKSITASLDNEQIVFLTETLYRKWKETTILLSNDEIEDFALKVHDYATTNELKELLEWAQTVTAYSKSFNIKQLYEIYNKFPNLIKKYKQL